MSAQTYTPGPWGIGPKPTQICSTPQGAMKYAPGGPYYHRLLADTAGKDARREGENIANARLMAAAPELLEALQTILLNVGDLNVVIHVARSAIAKATSSTAVNPLDGPSAGVLESCVGADED